jgi:hypothetical protein
VSFKRIRALTEATAMGDDDYTIIDNSVLSESRKITKANLLKEVVSGLDAKQNKDNNAALATTEKSIVPAINEINTKAEGLKTQVSNITGIANWQTAPVTNLQKLQNIMTNVKDPSGFVDPMGTTVTYSSTNRQITLTHSSGVVQFYYNGELISLTSPHVSIAHADVEGVYFYKYNGDQFTFDTTPWYFHCVQIAYLQYFSAFKFALKETHGANMDWSTHQHLHIDRGTLKTAGGDFSDFTLNSTTAANRRPNISNTTLLDEDLFVPVNLLTSKLYTQRYLTGADSKVFIQGASDIVPLSGNTPYWNQFTGGTWQQTLMTNGQYQAIFVVAIPVSSDSESQNYRYVFVQGQQVDSSLPIIESVIPADVNLGDPAILATEYSFIGKIIIRFQGGNWTLIRVEKLSGSRAQQIASPQGNYLSTVSVDNTTITGDGTSLNPLTAPTLQQIRETEGIIQSDGAGNVQALSIEDLTTSDQYRIDSLQLDADGYILVNYTENP